MTSTRKGNGRLSTRASNSEKDGHCYCKGARDINQLELWCSTCEKWFHGKCLKDLKDFFAPRFMVCYTFACQKCSTTGKETWVPKTANLCHMLVTGLANMTSIRLLEAQDNDSDQSISRLFSMKDEVIPYFEKNWEHLTSMPRRTKQTWHQSLEKTVLKDTDVFVSESNGPENEEVDLMCGLSENDLSKIGPNHECIKILGRRQPAGGDAPPAVATTSNVGGDSSDPGPKTRGAKRKAETQQNDKPNTSATGGSTNKKVKNTTDYAPTTVYGGTSVIEHPFNRDDYRYYLVEEDIHAPHRKEWHDSNDEQTAGKAHPPFLYRVVMPSRVELSSHDRAPQLQFTGDDRCSVMGEKGYSMIRATHGVQQGAWYYEACITDQPPGTHVRIGWAQELGCVQAPCGYDRFSYAWRSRKGTKFHQSKGSHYSSGYTKGDVLGFLIYLPVPQDSKKAILPRNFKQNLYVVKFKNQLYFEDKDDIPQGIRALKPLPGSKMICFKNGVCQGVMYENVFGGEYFPAVSIFQTATVTVNFGTTPFLYAPDKALVPAGVSIRPRAEELHVEQCVADMTYLVANEGTLSLEPGSTNY